MSDTLKDPDADLERGLKAEDHETAAYVLHAIVKPLEAGGVVPRRLRGEGTAVGRMIEELQGNAYIFHINSCSTASDAAETDWRALKQDSEAALRAVTGEG